MVKNARLDDPFLDVSFEMAEHSFQEPMLNSP